MAIHLLRDLENLKKEILLLGAMVEEATHKAILTVVDHRAELADEVIAGDREVDDNEVRVEEECLKVLALHQPVAFDLRFVLAVLKVNNDLERVGDLARNIAERGRDLAGHAEAVAVPAEIRTMAERVRRMLRESLNAVVQSDTALARRVLAEDETVDRLHKEIFTLVKQRLRESPGQVDGLIELLSTSRYLERIADLATNIAEDVVFMVSGEVIRHQGH
ncbi:MAG TPA: phosphate signaling complex protein PhoU [Thermoanaerobaculia bacterium]|jgi:phosphate transport system protein